MDSIDLEHLVEIRHWLHAHPELSREEFETAAYLRETLSREAAPDQIVDLHDAGFAAVYEGSQPGATIMLRTELDALPIQESNQGLPYISKTPGIGHKCGHDGHMAILMGVGSVFAKRRPSAGRIVLTFQPDEETGSGAKNSIGHKNFAQIHPDFVFALHNVPGYPAGHVIGRQGTFAAAVHYQAVCFTGRPAHSAHPNAGASPARAIAELTLLTEDLAKAASGPDGFALAVPIYTNIGVASSGVAPAKGDLHITLRSDDDNVVENMLVMLENSARQLAQKYGLDVAFETLEKFAATVNRPEARTLIEEAAMFLGKDYHLVDAPFRWGEDFGEFTNKTMGAMFGLGAGMEVPPLHDESYDFPDALILEGVTMLVELARRAVEHRSILET